MGVLAILGSSCLIEMALSNDTIDGISSASFNPPQLEVGSGAAPAQVAPKVEVQEKVDNKQETPSYWAAEIINNQVVIGVPLTLSEAVLRVATGGSIMCKDQAAAIAVLITGGYHHPAGPEKHGGGGFYWHYHPTRNHKGYNSIHIWYYS